MSKTIEEQHENQNVGGSVDVISQLPDCILHHILSFIYTKDVVKSSILSKRWNDLWTSIPNLYFDDVLFHERVQGGGDPLEENCFMDFIERVLLLHESNIDRFRLSFRLYFNASRIHSWISAAIMRKVHLLDLCLFVDGPFLLPRSMFSCVSLTSLKIEMNCVLELPISIHLPNLKTLHLSLVTFLDDYSTQKLLTGCPVLEELVLRDCDWTYLKNITIASSTLKHITIDDLPYFGPPHSPSICKITITASNLTYFKYTGYLSNEIYLNDTSSMVEAFICVSMPYEGHKEVASRVVNLLRGLQNVASLTVSNLTIESIIIEGSMLVRPPVFHKLTHFEVSMKIRNPTFRGLMKLLTCCPNLQSLYFAKGFEHDICLSEHDLSWSWLRLSNLSGIKMLTIKNFHGHDSEICFLKCVLQHGLVTNSINICCCADLLDEPNRQKQVKEALETFPWGCRSCVVTFS